MNMHPGGPHGRGSQVNDQYRVPTPKSIKELPSYIKKLFTTFIFRLTYIFKLVWEASPIILFVMVFMAVFNGVMPIAGSLIGKELLNSLARAYNGEITTFTIILSLLILQFAYLFISDIISRISAMITRICSEVVSNHIKLKIIDKSKEVDISSYDSPEFYAKMENANREAGSRPIAVLSSFFSVFSSVISIVGFIAILFSVSPWAPFVMILVSLPSTVINFVYRRKNVDFMFRRSKERRQMSYYSDVIVNKDLAKEIRIYNLTDTFKEKYKAVFAKYFKGLKKLIMSEFWLNLLAGIVATAVNCLLFIYIADGVFKGNYEVGDYSLYTGALNTISAKLASIISTTAMIYEGTLFINNMITFMNEEKHIKPTIDPPRQPQRHIAHEIKLENVSFKYPGTDRYVIKNISLTIKPGDTVVLVGLNGAGKTTLVKLLIRLYDPTEGRILLDGYDLREYDTKALYDMFGIIFQDYGKYAVSVSENIMFGDIDKTPNFSDVKSSAERSGADDFIADLPNEYDTPLMRYFEDNGIELSGGQWQKLAIARAFYGDSDILVLDEPTASLDPLAEAEIFNKFDELRTGKTSVFVSHRLSSATTASSIIVIENGQLCEMGSHSELMAAKGKYYELFTTQAKRYATGVVTEDTEN